jgi:uncharacterized protein (TIGR00251 family)
MAAWTKTEDGILLAVRVTPRASRPVLTAGSDTHFAARLSAPPVDGAANAALIALVADGFNVPRRAVALIAGERARLKRLRITGDPEMLAQRAAGFCQEQGTEHDSGHH